MNVNVELKSLIEEMRAAADSGSVIPLVPESAQVLLTALGTPVTREWPRSDASTDGGSRYEAPRMQDVLRRIPDLLKGDLIAFGGEVREVATVRLAPRSPGRVWLALTAKGGEEASALEFGVDTRVRVLRSHWEAPGG